MDTPGPDTVVEAHRAAGSTLPAAGAASFALDEGGGAAVVCMHGVPASSFTYRRLLPELASRGLRGIAFDLPGLGLAERPEVFDYRWTGLGRWSVGAIEALGLDELHLVVHDLGGPVGFEMAATLGDRVRSLTILNTITDPATFAMPPVMRPFRTPGLDKLWLAATIDPAFVALMRSQGVGKGLPRSEVLAHRRLLLRNDGGRAFLRIMKGFELTQEKSDLYRRTIRSIPHRQIIWGEQDPALSPKKFLGVAKRVADLDAATLLPAKHFLQEDCAPQIADLVAALVESSRA